MEPVNNANKKDLGSKKTTRIAVLFAQFAAVSFFNSPRPLYFRAGS